MNSLSDDDDSISESGSLNSCEEFISFESIRDPGTNLEQSICFSWPGIYEDDDTGSGDQRDEKKLHKIRLSTLLEEDDIAPIFDGSRWAGTRLWGAAIRGIQYVTGHLSTRHVCLERLYSETDKRISMLELGCGLGVPGMIYHLLGNNVVLTDQANILRQLEKNVMQNFPDTAVKPGNPLNSCSTIQALPLSWSIDGITDLLDKLNLSNIGFDVVLNCDCVFEPLYGKSWIPLNESINELLRVNCQCVVVTSVERRRGDNIDSFMEMMRGMEFVGSVDKVWEDDKGKPIEIYVTCGILPNA